MRLLTRYDFDGLGCAVLLKELGLVEEIKFVHPKDIQDGIVEVNENDVLTNIPYLAGCGLWFDHHSSEHERKAFGYFNGASDPSAPSATRVVFDYYGGERTFPGPFFRDLVDAVSKADTAQLTVEEILNPRGWVLLAFIMDPRTGLGRYDDYRISNYQMMMDMIDYCRTKSIDEILAIPDVEERVARYLEQDRLFRTMLLEHSSAGGNAVVTDLRSCKEIYTGNRFIIYSLFPEQNISVQVMWGVQRRNVVISCGHSIITKTSPVNVGSLMLKYGGGGHEKAGTCQVPTEKADAILQEILGVINPDT